MGGADVADGGGDADAEYPDELDRVGSVVGFVEDAVGAQLASPPVDGTFARLKMLVVSPLWITLPIMLRYPVAAW